MCGQLRIIFAWKDKNRNILLIRWLEPVGNTLQKQTFERKTMVYLLDLTLNRGPHQGQQSQLACAFHL